MATPVRAIYENGRLRLLDPVSLKDGEQVSITILPVAESHGISLEPDGNTPRPSARDLLKMAAGERDQALAAAADQAAQDYLL